MKKLILFSVIILGWHQVWAQSHEPLESINIGVTSRIGAFNLTQKFVPVSSEKCVEGCRINHSSPSLNLSLGFKVRLFLSDNMGISSGLLYASSTYHEKYIGNNGANNFSILTKRNFNFVNIPLLLHGTLHSFTQESFSFFGEIGIINQLNLTSKFPDTFSTITLKRHGISGLVSVGARFTKYQYLFELSPYFMHSLTSFGTDISQEDTNSHTFVPYSIGFTISILYTL
ncbi:outer membrane beta-barrel protein [Fodinibius halophilus]|uniref:PorT family protein n=1 Tax=Fodinibius halophilus TaxID=1736908 RepID=A0A6M1TFZ3_9BACT|nr:outer membrane beta-barrel protein [Fodinibius halophilus]NGP89032.1 PorT family protein [Fodinibius halophilus]